jgi:hypothetical protein
MEEGRGCRGKELNLVIVIIWQHSMLEILEHLECRISDIHCEPLRRR